MFEQFRQAIAEGSLNLSAEHVPLPLALSAEAIAVGANRLGSAYICRDLLAKRHW